MTYVHTYASPKGKSLKKNLIVSTTTALLKNYDTSPENLSLILQLCNNYIFIQLTIMLNSR